MTVGGAISIRRHDYNAACDTSHITGMAFAQYSQSFGNATAREHRRPLVATPSRPQFRCTCFKLLRLTHHSKFFRSSIVPQIQKLIIPQFTSGIIINFIYCFVYNKQIYHFNLVFNTYSLISKWTFFLESLFEKNTKGETKMYNFESDLKMKIFLESLFEKNEKE